MTVQEIIERYRGNVSSDVYSGIAKIWGNDLNMTYDPDDPNSDDWITEVVIQDILSGRIEFDIEMRRMNKTEYKVSMKQYREKARESKSRIREIKRKEKKRKKEERKKERAKKEPPLIIYLLVVCLLHC